MACNSRAKFLSLFGSAKNAVIGMVHVQALPGTPKHHLPLDKIIEKACSEAAIYHECGLDGIMVENMHDIPYLRCSVGPEITACMTMVCAEVRRVVGGMPLGVQTLSGANKEAMAVAKASGANFIRAEGFVFSHVADEGWMDACAGELLRYRGAIDAKDVLVFTDIKKKHSSHAVTSDLDVGETAQAADFFLSDGVILTGVSTGLPTNTDDIRKVRSSVDLPVIIGSGVTVDNLDEYMTADAMIVGSHFKVGGKWYNDVDREQVERFMARLSELRKQ